jgi:hypothetical protein
MSCASGECAKPLIPVSVQPQTLCSNEIYQRFKDAVVSINAIPKFSLNAPFVSTGLGVPGAFNLTTGLTGSATGSPTGGVSIPAIPVLPLAYSGFFYENQGFIVSTSAFLYAFVLALFYNQLYYAMTGQTTLNPAPAIPPVLINIEQVIQFIFDPNNPRSLSDFFDIFITVFNVNNCGRAFVYRGCIIGVDFATGIAIYRIDPCDPWNKCNETIKKHIFLKWGNSKCYVPGSPAHIIGTQAQQSPQTMSSGSIVSNSNVLTNGTINYESVLTDVVVLDGVEGAPILDQCGFVVGVVTGRTGNVLTTNQPAAIEARLLGSVAPAITTQMGTAFGVASAFIGLVVERLIANYLRPDCENWVLYVSLFGFSVYRHATLGANYYFRTGAEVGLYGADVVYPVDISRWYDPSYCKINREVMGVVVKSVYGPLTETYEDCTSLQFPVFQNKIVVAPSPDFIGYQVEPFDIITGLNGLTVGQLFSQISPETLLYNLSPCDTLTVQFLKASESYTKCHQLCTALGDSLGFLFNLPAAYNPVDGAVSLNVAAMQQVLSWFTLTLSQIDRAYLASLALAGSVTPLGVNGSALLSAILSGHGQVYTDPLNLLSIANSAVIVPAVSFNLNYMNTINIGSQTFFQNYLP